MNATLRNEEDERAARDRLRAAVTQLPASPRLNTRVRQKLAEPPFDIWAHARVAALLSFTGLLVVFGPDLSKRLGLVEDQALLRVGLQNHLDCALHHSHGREPQRTALPPVYRELATGVAAALSPDQRLVDFHECHHRGRTLAHLVIQGSQGLLSLVIARRRLGDVVESRQSQLDHFAVHELETKAHFIFLVSPQSVEESRALLHRLQPGLRHAIAEAER